MGFAVFLGVFLLGGGRLCRAEDGTIVAIAVSDTSSGIELRVKAELESIGFQVLLVDVDPENTPQKELNVAAREAGASAAVLCLKSKGTVEIWIADRVTGKTVLRQVNIPSNEEDADSVVALGTVELLRASLLEVKTSHEPQGEVQPTDPVEQLVKQRENERIEPLVKESSTLPILSFEVAPALFVASFESPPMMNLHVALHLRVYHSLGVSVLGQIPLIPSRLSDSEGDALVRFGLIGGGLQYGFEKAGRPLNAYAGTGWSAVLTRINGSAYSGYVGHETLIGTSAPYVMGGVSYEILQRLRLRFNGIVGWSISQIDVHIGGRSAAAMGHLLLAATLGLEIGIL